ncbi:MAG: M1 family peptidase [Saprospirales bacterium]|nr:MAG: M1 family peptidase [Saprospirales bacterium]
MIDAWFSKKHFAAFFVILSFVLLGGLGPAQTAAQESAIDYIGFMACDTLKGWLSPLRTAYTVDYYDLRLQICEQEKTLTGTNEILFTAADSFDKIQIDLHENMLIDSIVFQTKHLEYRRECSAVFVRFPDVEKGYRGRFLIGFSGSPKVASNPPWSGGAVWANNEEGHPWFAITCQSEGASLWWPCKDHLYDQPDSMLITLTVREEYVAVSNGSFVKKEPAELPGWKKWTWKVNYPISNYNVTYYAGNFKHHRDFFFSIGGDTVVLDYFVLPENYQISKTHFKQVHDVLEAFEYYFGPYPFPKDGYKLVESPYVGMEHQTAIAYGNQYSSGYLGIRTLPELDFDYIILHETAHEYFGNSVSCTDLGDMWIQESFATYMEALFVEYHFGKTTAEEYLGAQRRQILNIQPVAGPLNVNFHRYRIGNDQYFKGSWMLHTLRHYINDDQKWWRMLNAIYNRFAYQAVDRYELLSLISALAGEDLDWFFHQYLHQGQLPNFQIEVKESGEKLVLKYRWTNTRPDFRLPVKIELPDGRVEILQATIEYNTHHINDMHWRDTRIMSETFLADWEWVN